MKRVNKTLVIFVCSFAVGVCIAPVFNIEKEKEPVSEPTKKPIQHYLNRYGETIKRTV
jgi:flagellar basal body-associated protein FliL